MKKCLLLLSTICCVFINIANAQVTYVTHTTPKYVVYWADWNIPNIDPSPLTSAVTAINLAFANIDPNTLQPTDTDGIINPDAGKGWKEAAYNRWTQFKLAHPNTKFLLSFGGATYSNLWTTTLTANNAEQIAQNIATIINTSYPVYQFDSEYKPHVVGQVTLNGVDLDIEGSSRLTDTQVHNAILLIQDLRKALPTKLISVTGFSTAADPVSCETQKSPQYSYVNSLHSGELIPLLEQTAHLINWVNDMAYDAGQDYNYESSVNNYQQYVGKNNVMLGLDLEMQWDPHGKFLESLPELKAAAKWAGENTGGAMVWALGVTNPGDYPLDQQLSIIQQLGDQLTLGAQLKPLKTY